MLFIIVTIFILLHIPFAVLIFLRTKLLKTAIMNQLTGKIYLLSWFAHFCLFANAAINPIVYGLTNDNFRRAYQQTPIIPKQFGQFWLNFVKKFKYKVCDTRKHVGFGVCSESVCTNICHYPFRFVFICFRGMLWREKKLMYSRLSIVLHKKQCLMAAQSSRLHNPYHRHPIHEAIINRNNPSNESSTEMINSSIRMICTFNLLTIDH